MKKLLAAMLCMVLVLSCSAAAFAVEKPTFTITPETVEAAPGDTIEFTVSIETEDKCRTLGLIPQFDASVFEIVEGEAILDNALISTYAPDRGFVFLFAAAVKPKGEILTFKLKVRDTAPAGTYEIDFKVSMKDKDASIETEVEPAKITVVRLVSDPTAPPKETEKPTEPPKATEPAEKTEEVTVPATEATEATEAAEPTAAPTNAPTEPQPAVTKPVEPTAAETQGTSEVPTGPAVTAPTEPREFQFPMWAIPIYAIGFALIIIILILKRRLK